MIDEILARIDETERPPYRRILSAIERAIEENVLAVGTQLPTQRELCHALNVAVATVTRAYGEAEKRGLVYSRVGSGTFVAQRERFHSPKAEAPPSGFIDLAMYRVDINPIRPLLRELNHGYADIFGTDALNLHVPFGTTAYNEAGKKWFARCGADVTAQNIIPCNGGQHGMLVALAACSHVGDLILTERITDPALKAVAMLLGRNLKGVDADEEGVIPGELARSAVESGARVVFLTTALHNPSTATLSEQRRRDIAKIAREHDLTVIESLMYAGLMSAAPQALASYIPERTVIVSSLAKVLGPGSKVGFVAGHSNIVDKLAAAVSISTGRISALSFEFFSRCTTYGLLDQMVLRQRNEICERTNLTRRIFGATLRAPRDCAHAWLTLPHPWRSDEFISQLREQGVMTAYSHSFVIERGQTPHAVRLCIGSPPGIDTLKIALDKIFRLANYPHIFRLTS